MTYSPEQVAAHKAVICERIAKGQSLRAICAEDGLPSERTVYEWLVDDQTFSQNYARAREQQADYFADEIIEIADTEPDAAKARNRIEARKWKASKLVPKKYGDKLDLNHSGAIDTMSKEQVDARLAVLLGKAGIGPAAGAAGVAGADEQAPDV